MHSFGGDRAGFVRWLDGRDVNEQQRAAMEKIWREVNPAPLVTIEHAYPTDSRPLSPAS